MKNKTNPKIKKTDYRAKDIYVLQGLEPVRKRPGMYIGSTGLEGLHRLIFECVANSIDEAIMGYCSEIRIKFLPENRIEIKDNGRGIPIDKHSQTKKSALETVMTTLHAGAKFGGKAYASTGGLHGVGVSAVCALSKYMRVEVCREKFRYFQEYSKGKPLTKVKKIGTCKESGTMLVFEPDSEIFKALPPKNEPLKFNFKKILNYLRQQAYLTRGIKILISDLRETEKKSYCFYFEGGIVSYVRHLIGENTPRHSNIFYVSGEKEQILVEVAFQYTQEIEFCEQGFANNVYTNEGGSHITGFRSALTRTLNDYAKKEGYLKGADENLSGEDTREGLTVVISVKLQEPQFEGQTKARLGNPEAKSAVEQVVSEGLSDFLDRNPGDAKGIMAKCLLAQKARKAAKAARTTVLRKGILEGLTLPGKLTDCISRKPEESELYIVEGESAGGCWIGDTKIALVDGRNISFKELVREDRQGKKNFCYTMHNNGHIGIAPILNPRMTKKNTEVIKIILDTGEKLICTPDHLFRLVDGSYIPASKLTPKDSLAPLYRKISKKQGWYGLDGYEMLFDPKAKKWIYTHILADMFNLRNNIYTTSVGKHRHHADFNKRNNNPINIQRLSYEQHMNLHYDYIEHTLRRPDVIKKSIKTKQTKEYRKKISKMMTTPEMRKMLSKRAKKQWENEEYKQYMTRKFLEFYKENADYREKNKKILYENQKKYWSSEVNRKRQAERVKKYFEQHPEKGKELSQKAKKQWQNEELLNWRKEKTQEQWTPEFRVRRKKTYNQTYLNKALKLLKEIYEKCQKIDIEKYNKERIKRNDKSILRYDTIRYRFFDGNEQKLKEDVLNYNHRIKRIIRLSKKTDVYDFEVESTHNFALACGVFVHNSSRQARDRRFQAILPLRGKILNVERARLDKILSSVEIRALITSLGASVAEDFNLDKLRYHKIIIMSDADSDGNHIRTLLLTLFFRYFKPIIENGYLYIAQPPLYKIQVGKKIEYAYNEEGKNKILSSIKTERAPDIQRYKGLGEMNSDELWETTMNPENRILLKIAIEDAEEADRIFDTLMGQEVPPRKKFIQLYAKKVRNLDI